jgi:hypothetical protein
MPCAPVVVCPPQAAPVACAEPALPPEAQPGEVWCYIRVPAVTQTINESVMVTPPSCREEWVPPVTQEVTENVCIKPEEVRRVPVPAEFEDKTERVMTCDAKTEWRRVDCQPKNMNQGEQVGECWTLVQLPPQYVSRTTRVCVRPESCREEVVPAQYAPQTRVVTVQEGYAKKVDVPAVYETRTREVEVSPARWEWRRTNECELPPTPLPGTTEPAAPVATEAPVAPEAVPAIPPAPSYDSPPAGELPPAPEPAPPAPAPEPPPVPETPPAPETPPETPPAPPAPEPTPEPVPPAGK